MAPLLLPEGSHETVKSELQIFDRPEYQVSQLHGDWIEFKPTTPCVGTDTSTPILFDIPAADGLYTDLSSSFIVLDVCLLRTADVCIGKDAKVGVINLALSSLFKDVAILINNQKIEGDSQMYAYKSYLYNLLAASSMCKKYQLAASGWTADEAEKYDLEANAGHTAKRLWTISKAATATVIKNATFAGPLFLDVALQKQYLTDRMNITLKFTRQSHMFEIMNYFFNSGVENISIPNLTPGIFPKCLFIGMVETAAYNGKYNKNPYNFQHFNLTEIGIMMNGQHTPSTPFKPNFTNEHFLREYLALFMATGRFGIHKDDNGVSMKDFAGGCAIFPFTFAPDLSLDGFAQPIRMSHIRLDIKFGSVLATNITLIVFALCDTLFEYTANNLVLLDNTQMPS